jgi:hypothetical protein
MPTPPIKLRTRDLSFDNKRDIIKLYSNIQKLRFIHRIDPIKTWIPFDFNMKLLKSRKKYLVMITANRVSKTQWIVGDLSMYAMGRHPLWKTPRSAISWLVVLKNDMVNLLIPRFRAMLKPPEGINWTYNGNENIFYVKCGSGWNQIVIKSQEAKSGSFEGAEVHRLAFDEQPWEETYRAACLRTVSTGGQVLFGATMYEEGISWAYDEFILPVKEGFPNAKNIELVGEGLTMYHNCTLDQWEVDEIFRSYSLKNEEEARVRVSGEYIPISGRNPFSKKALDYSRSQCVPGEDCEFVMGVN